MNAMPNKPTVQQQGALKLASKTGILRRVSGCGGGCWLPADAPDDLPEAIQFSYGCTMTVRACIKRGWLESMGRNLVGITLVGKRVLVKRRLQSRTR
jgi:hypothetical protein